MSIIDCHTHLGRNAHISASVDQLIASMDQSGISKALVFAGALADVSNEYLYQQIAPYKNRLYGVAACHPNTFSSFSRQAYIDKLKLDIDSGKAHAVKFYLGYDHWYPNDPNIYDILKILQDKNIPAIFHCGDCLCSAAHAKLKYAHPLGIDEVAVDFPDLKIVIAHLGYPYHRDTAQVCYKNKNVYTDISGFVYGAFNLESKEAFKKMMREFREILGGDDPANKLLFGSDFPISDQGSYASFIIFNFGYTFLEATTKNALKVFSTIC